MSAAVLGLVLLGALLHALWNALLKGGPDKALSTPLLQLTASALALPCALWLGWPPAAAWPYLLLSSALHLLYYSALIGAYRHGELGLSYPLMRGSAPLLLALWGSAAGEPLAPLAWLGVLAIVLGVLLLGLGSVARLPGRGLAFALGNAVVIACYTLADAHGVRATVHGGVGAAHYVAALFVFHGWPFGLLVLARRGPGVWQEARQHAPRALGAAAASMLSYGIALWAMGRAPVALVAALRETSVLFALLLGALWLGERLTRLRLLGGLCMVAGVATLRLLG